MTSNRLYGPLDDVSGDAGYVAGHPQRVGFFTDTSVCIGCKACEVACKEWNGLPDPEADALVLTGMSYDNTAELGANSWRHVAFIEQAVPAASAPALSALSRDAEGELIISASVGDTDDGGSATRWLMASDVCKHCTHAACLDVCPTGALVRTEFGTVIVQPDVCNGCAYCVSACPFGVIDRREGDGRAWKCTMCYDRLRGGLEPACAKACPTDSIQFGPLSELRETAQARLAELHAAGVPEARLYGDDPDDGVGGTGAFFLLLDEPAVYGLPPDPVVTTRDLPAMWRWAGIAAGVLAAGVAVAFTGRAGRAGRP
ncbi:MAG TPA: 4Fe-4S dicluster domain-containing protein [Streptosporangiaceae bacterium]|jgi:formate dehydrogenase iron-sulfur subunit|nr:4Fe-4S dicluster domain-containing protein [Streptosporangiaceae bacterium]